MLAAGLPETAEPAATRLLDAAAVVFGLFALHIAALAASQLEFEL